MASPSVTIIGAGIAGLAAGVYAQRAGLRSEIFEMHTQPGGLMTAWTRSGYTFDTCIRSLIGAGAASAYHPRQRCDLSLLVSDNLYTVLG